MRGVSLEEVSAATRISTRFLEAIESDRWESLPGGVFNRGFIRSVARYLGLDEDSMVAEYALETRGRVETGVVPDPPMEIPRNWKPAILAGIVLVTILVGVGFAYARYGGKIAARLRGKPAAATAPAASATPGDAPRGANDAAAAATAAVTDPLELTLQSSKLIDLSIMADGTAVFSGSIDAGDSRQFEAHDAFEITASDSSAIVLELNGRRIAAFGQPGLPGSVKLTRNDLKAPAGDSH